MILLYYKHKGECVMPKTCKNCNYKKQYDSYCKEQSIQNNIEKSKDEILKELQKNKIDYSQKPSEDVIRYCKEVKKGLETQNSSYRKLLYIIHGIFLVICIAICIFTVVCSMKEKNYENLVVIIPFLLFIVAEILLIIDARKKDEQQAYNSIMAIVAVISLILAVIGLLR